MPLNRAEYFNRLVGHWAGRTHQPEAAAGSFGLDFNLPFLVVDHAAPSLAVSLYLQYLVQLRHHSLVETLLRLRVALNARVPVRDALDVEDRYLKL